MLDRRYRDRGHAWMIVVLGVIFDIRSVPDYDGSRDLFVVQMQVHFCRVSWGVV